MMMKSVSISDYRTEKVMSSVNINSNAGYAHFVKKNSILTGSRIDIVHIVQQKGLKQSMREA